MYDINHRLFNNIDELKTDLDILIVELELIKDNYYGEINNYSDVCLNHSEVRKMIATLIKAIENHTIHPFLKFNFSQCNYIIFNLKLISTYGINHKQRSFFALKCVEYLKLARTQIEDREKVEKKKMDTQDTHNDDWSDNDDWSEIPF